MRGNNFNTSLNSAQGPNETSFSKLSWRANLISSSGTYHSTCLTYSTNSISAHTRMVRPFMRHAVDQCSNLLWSDLTCLIIRAPAQTEIPAGHRVSYIHAECVPSTDQEPIREVHIRSWDFMERNYPLKIQVNDPSASLSTRMGCHSDSCTQKMPAVRQESRKWHPHGPSILPVMNEMSPSTDHIEYPHKIVLHINDNSIY